MDSNGLKRILIVEDSKDVQGLLAHLLSTEGYQVDCVGNGQEAIDYLNSNPSLPGVILLDLMMPVMDGYQFRQEQQRHSRFAAVPVVVMTAAGDVKAESLKVGSVGFLKKPFLDITTVLDTVAQFFKN